MQKFNSEVNEINIERKKYFLFNFQSMISKLNKNGRKALAKLKNAINK